MLTEQLVLEQLIPFTLREIAPPPNSNRATPIESSLTKIEWSITKDSIMVSMESFNKWINLHRVSSKQIISAEERKEEVKMAIHLSKKLDLKLNIERSWSNPNQPTSHLSKPDVKSNKKSLIAPKMKFSLWDILQRVLRIHRSLISRLKIISLHLITIWCHQPLLENKLLVLQVQEVLVKRKITPKLSNTTTTVELHPITAPSFHALRNLRRANIKRTMERRTEELTARTDQVLGMFNSNSSQAWLVIVNTLKICIKALIKWTYRELNLQSRSR